MIDFSLSAPELAVRLLGCLLCRRFEDGRTLRLPITETEAYFGEEDSACHAHRGRTTRNAPLYEAGGIAYIYLIYGMYEMLNVVSGEAGHPEAVLLRGVTGFPGPGRLTREMGVTRALAGCDLSREPTGAGLWLIDREVAPLYSAHPRVGIAYASERDRARLWRFVAEE